MSRLGPGVWGVQTGLCEAPQAIYFLRLFPCHPSAQMKPGHFISPSKAESFIGRVDFFSLVSALSILSTKDPSSPGAAEAFTSPPFRRGTHPKFPLASHARSRSFRFPFVCRWVGPLQRRAAACVGRGRHGRPPPSFAVPRRPCLGQKSELLETAAGLRLRAGRSVT